MSKPAIVIIAIIAITAVAVGGYFLISGKISTPIQPEEEGVTEKEAIEEEPAAEGDKMEENKMMEEESGEEESGSMEEEKAMEEEKEEGVMQEKEAIEGKEAESAGEEGVGEEGMMEGTAMEEKAAMEEESATEEEPAAEKGPVMEQESAEEESVVEEEALEEKPSSGYIDVTPAEAKNLIDTVDDLIVVDVSPHYEEGHLPGAVNYYLGDGSLDEAIPTLDKDGKYLVYCHVDSAAIGGAQKLIDAGFSPVYRLEGNYSAWVEAGYPVEK